MLCVWFLGGVGWQVGTGADHRSCGALPGRRDCGVRRGVLGDGFVALGRVGRGIHAEWLGGSLGKAPDLGEGGWITGTVMWGSLPRFRANLLCALGHVTLTALARRGL